jgi:hypothetical protein
MDYEEYIEGLLIFLYICPMNFKTQEELDQFIQLKKSTSYQTELSRPLTPEEVSILIKPSSDISLGSFNRIQNDFEVRITSVIQLLLEIEGLKFNGWESTTQPFQDHVRFYEKSYFFVYPYDAHKSSIDSILENQMPVEYLYLDKDDLINKFLDTVKEYHSSKIKTLTLQSEKRKSDREKYLNTLLSIKEKVSNEEFKFILRKCDLTKKEYQKIID